MTFNKKFADSQHEFFSILFSRRFDVEDRFGFPSAVFGTDIRDYAACADISSVYFDDDATGLAFTECISKIQNFNETDAQRIIGVISFRI